MAREVHGNLKQRYPHTKYQDTPVCQCLAYVVGQTPCTDRWCPFILGG